MNNYSSVGKKKIILRWITCDKPMVYLSTTTVAEAWVQHNWGRSVICWYKVWNHIIILNNLLFYSVEAITVVYFLHILDYQVSLRNSIYSYRPNMIPLDFSYVWVGQCHKIDGYVFVWVTSQKKISLDCSSASAKGSHKGYA